MTRSPLDQVGGVGCRVEPCRTCEILAKPKFCVSAPLSPSATSGRAWSNTKRAGQAAEVGAVSFPRNGGRGALSCFCLRTETARRPDGPQRHKGASMQNLAALNFAMRPAGKGNGRSGRRTAPIGSGCVLTTLSVGKLLARPSGSGQSAGLSPFGNRRYRASSFRQLKASREPSSCSLAGLSASANSSCVSSSTLSTSFSAPPVATKRSR